MKLVIKFLLLITLFSSCKAQKPRIETKLQDCYNSHYKKNGNEINESIAKFENLLISNKLLKSKKNKDYIELLTKIEKNEIVRLNLDFKELDSIKNINKRFGFNIFKCQQAVLNSKKYDTLTYSKLQRKTDSLIKSNHQISSSIFAKELLSTLYVKDFELNYYKLMTFRILYMYDFELKQGFPEVLNDNKSSKKTINYKNPCRISINEKDEISVNGKIIPIEKLKASLKEYEQNEKENSAIILSSSRKASFGIYSKVIDVINNGIKEIMNDYSINEFNIEYEKLDDKKKSVIRDKCTIRIVGSEIIE
jgi:biopolymer transport protein ExbD